MYFVLSIDPNYIKKIVQKNIIWTCPKQIGPDQNDLYPFKTIWMVENNFVPIEGQGISFKKLPEK